MDSSIDQQFVEFVVKSLVSNPDAVQVARRIDEKGVLLELTVDPEDLGRVIGKRGATAQSIRTLLRALGTKNDARYNLKIVDNGVGEHAHADGEVRTDVDRPASPVASKPQNDNDTTTSDDVSDDSSDDRESDVVRNTRKELEDLDDLDV